MRAVFFGTPPTAVPALQALSAGGVELPFVVTRPDRPVGRSSRPRPPAVKRAAAELGLEVRQPERVRSRSFRESLAAVRPDVLVVVAFGKIFSARLLCAAPLGAVNLHFSLLPAYRGAAPVQWALARGATETGVTTMQMDEGLDEGEILLQRATEVGAQERAPQLAERLARLGAPLLLETLRGLEAGTLAGRPQEDADATHAPILTRADGEIDPALPAAAIAARIRGFDPWPGVWLRRGRRRIRLLDGAPAERGAQAPPGTVIGLDDDALLLACGRGSVLRLVSLQPEGRRALAARDAVNGRQLVPGDRLEPCAG